MKTAKKTANEDGEEGDRQEERREKASKTGKYVYLFGKKTDGNGSMKPLLGGKGANLAEMCRIGLPVPPGFTITTEVCTYYYDHKRSYPSALQAQMKAGVAAIEKQTKKKFGDLKNPLLVSVRSGARDSMPGMMDTILNLGLNDQTVEALAKKTNNPRFAWDCYRRFVQMYGDVVLGVQKGPGEDHEPFEVVIEKLKHDRYHQDIEDTKLTVEDLKELVVRFKALVKERAGKNFPASPWDQLMGAVGAVFGSWMNDRAIVYRRKYNIPTEWGTAVNVQAMVYGNTGDNSGSGVAFTRNPANGAKEFYGEFLINAQGEDVVAGVRTPEPVARVEEADAEGVSRARTHPADAGAALQGRAGLRVHDRRRRRLHAADAERQAHGDGRAQVLDGHAQGAAHRLEDGGHAQSRRPARTAPGAGVRCGGDGQGEGDRDRPARRTWRGIRTDLSERRSRGDRGGKGREGAARARRDVARGSPRHDRGRRHSHGARRRVVARRARRPADGEGLRLRRGRRGCGLPGTHGHRRRPDLQGRRLDVHRRDRRQGVRRPGQDGAVGNRRRPARWQRGRQEDRKVQELPAAHEVVRSGDAHERAHQRRHTRADEQRDRVRRGRHRPVPHRAHVLRGRSHRRDARDDPRRDARGAEGRPRQAAAVSARGLRRHLPRPQGLPGDHPVPRSAAARVPAAHAGAAVGSGKEDRRVGRGDSVARPPAARVQPDARLPRLPPGHWLSGNLGRCRPARCSRPRPSSRKRGSRSAPRS